MDFFVAYHAADQGWAEWIGAQLRAQGYSVELQSWDYWTGASFILEMFAASAVADSTIAVLSPDFLAENLERPEWNAACAQDPCGDKGILIPVLVRQCAAETLPPRIAPTDLTGLSEEAAVKALLAAVAPARG